jgi:hypothetical protein
MIAVGGGYEAPPDPRLQFMLAHQPPDLLMVRDDALLAQRGADAAIAVKLERVADREHTLHERGVVGRHLRAVIVGRARDPISRHPLVTEMPPAGDGGCSPASGPRCVSQSPL